MWTKKKIETEAAVPSTVIVSPPISHSPYEMMPFKELFALQTVVNDCVERRRAGARAEFESLFGLSEKGGKPKKKKRNFPIKYRDPENAENTWSGMGKPKKWLQNYLDQGRALADFAVPGADA